MHLLMMKRNVYRHLAAWSRGMILVSGAGGRGFDSRSSPYFLVVKFIIDNILNSLFIIKLKVRLFLCIKPIIFNAGSLTSWDLNYIQTGYLLLSEQLQVLGCYPCWHRMSSSFLTEDLLWSPKSCSRTHLYLEQVHLPLVHLF
jgi:hypothetical protein